MLNIDDDDDDDDECHRSQGFAAHLLTGSFESDQCHSHTDDRAILECLLVL